MKKYTRVICIILALSFFLITPAKATSETDIQPLYDYVSTIHLDLEINSNTGLASCSTRVVPSGYIPADVELKLQRLINGSWVTFMSWEASDTGKVTIEKSYYVYKGYYYRLSVDVTVYNASGTVIDSVTENSSRQWYS